MKIEQEDLPGMGWVTPATVIQSPINVRNLYRIMTHPSADSTWNAIVLAQNYGYKLEALDILTLAKEAIWATNLK